MIVCEIQRPDFASFPIVNIDSEEKKCLEHFSTNPDCHFWIAKEKDGLCALLIGELKFGKLEIFRFFSKSQPTSKYLFGSIIDFLIEQQNIFGIALFQNLQPYFCVLEEMGFAHDVDIFMELNINSWQGPSTSLPSLDFAPLNKSHFSLVHSLRKRSYTNDFYQRLVPEEQVDAYCRDAIEWMFNSEGNNFTFVGKQNSEYIGIVSWDEGEEPELHDIMVFPEKQGQGYGTALLQKAICSLKKEGVPKLKLGVFQSNIPARRCYERTGFIEIERLTMMYWRRGVCG
jgi:ribosomal protein S18 acetylase RimI-like enzyme